MGARKLFSPGTQPVASTTAPIWKVLSFTVAVYMPGAPSRDLSSPPVTTVIFGLLPTAPMSASMPVSSAFT